MKKEIGAALEKIFADYEQTAGLHDFKEEIAANLTERVRDLTLAGQTESQALAQALNELGDITEAADAVSRQKRQEVIGQAYGKTPPLDKIHAIGYPIAGLVLLFGVVVAAIVGFSRGEVAPMLGSLMPFAIFAIAAFTYLGLTQETRNRYAMRWQRALLYVLAAFLLSFGGFVSGITLFQDLYLGELFSGQIASIKAELIAINPIATLGALIPFVLPGLALLAFLILTEKNRLKPWVLQHAAAQEFIYDERFGLLTAALWICAIALFILLGLTIGWRISWLMFLFALAGQLLLQYYALRRHKQFPNT